jgi:toxin YhaV
VANPSTPKAPLLGAQRFGWHLVPYPAFRNRLVALAGEVTGARGRNKPGWEGSPTAKLLKRVVQLITNEIPRNPAAPEYEQGNTLGADARGWRRAKFLGRFRLFFRFDTRSRIIIYAWVNDEGTLRKEGSTTDPYAVFRAMLLTGNPPHGWDALLDACRSQPDAAERQSLEALLGPMTPAVENDGGPAAKPKNTKRAKRR